MNTPRLFGMSLATRGYRRFVVGLMYGMLVLATVVGRLGKHQGSTALKFSALLPAAIAVLAYLAIYRFTRCYAISTSKDVAPTADERESRVRDKAMGLAYLYMGLIAMFASLWMSLQADGQSLWVPRTSSDWLGVTMAIQILFQTVPQAIISWTEPDLPAPDLPTDQVQGVAAYYPR